MRLIDRMLLPSPISVYLLFRYFATNPLSISNNQLDGSSQVRLKYQSPQLTPLTLTTRPRRCLPLHLVVVTGR